MDGRGKPRPACLYLLCLLLVVFLPGSRGGVLALIFRSHALEADFKLFSRGRVKASGTRRVISVSSIKEFSCILVMLVLLSP